MSIPKNSARLRKTSDKYHFNPSQSRNEIAQRAAKLLITGSAQNFYNAKRKAAKQLGFKWTVPLPSDTEIEDSLFFYQNLFSPKEYQQRLLLLRQTALKAMTLFETFFPQLVGPVHSGILTHESAINLLLFSNPTEALDLFLIDKDIPFQMGLTPLPSPDNEHQQMATYRIQSQKTDIDLIVLPLEMRKKLPLHRKINTLFYRGLNKKQLEQQIGESASQERSP